ncbi:MAG: ABC transporter ATP-binding protein [Planctomycetaceae bacterium]|nr:ABC transporter ATP-binding protein [Planctomycetaceae bacterium]
MSSHIHETPIFRTENVSKLYPDGQVHAVEDVSISIRRGEYVSIMGPSGSGKSSLLNMIGTLDRPTAGEIYFEGQPYSKIRNLDRVRSQKFGFVFQSFYLLPILTSLENVQVPMFEGRLSGTARVRKAKELLDLVGMSHRMNHMPQKLSVGERQRVAIARSLVNDPIVLLADEPTGNLDSVSAEGVFELFAHLHQQQGMTIVLITHDEEFGQRAQRTIHMQDGHVRSDVSSAHRRIRTPMPPFAV